MIKIGFFVEGQTERIFIEKLLDQYLTHPYFTVESVRLLGDKVSIVTRGIIHSETKYYFYICDVSGDGHVISTLSERAKNLIENQNYKMLFALRDLYPIERKDKCRFVRSVKEQFNKTSFGDNLKLILAVMEIESWFLGDYNVFSLIDKHLTPEFINSKLKINLFNDNPELYKKPSTEIKSIFQLIKKDYTKKEKQAHNICHKIDYNLLCCNEELHSKLSSLKYLLNCIDKCLESL